MGLTKIEGFSESQILLAGYFKAISHPARIAIIKYLIENPECICNDIVKFIPLSQSTISQHLKELKTIGLIKGEILPPKVCYCIDFEVWEKFQNLIKDVFNSNNTINKNGNSKIELVINLNTNVRNSVNNNINKIDNNQNCC